MDSNYEKFFEELEINIKKNYKKFSIDFKLKVINLVNLNISIHSISDGLGIDLKTIGEWVNNSSALSEIRNNKKRFRLGKTNEIIKNFSDTEENEIIKWSTEWRNRNLLVSTKSLIGYASTINTNFANKSVSAKLKWAYRFIKRNGFAILRISLIGQKIPEEQNEKIKKFISDIIQKRKEIFIEEDKDYRVINMDETGIFLEMGFNTTIDFKGNKHIDIDTNGREHYRLKVMLSAAGDGTKLAPLIIIKGEPGKTVETKLRNLSYVKNNNMYIYCQNNSWCNKYIFQKWINIIYKPYEKSIGDKCLIIIDKASTHASDDSLELLKNNNINYILIPSGMTSLLQPIDLSVNKIFKDNIRYLFEKDRLLYDNILPKIKIETARLNILNFINEIWNNKELINPPLIINVFKKCGLIGNTYISLEEEKIRESAFFDLNLNFNNFDIIDDIGKEWIKY